MEKIEELNKINALTKEFLSHNICKTHDEAYTRAVSIIKGEQEKQSQEERKIELKPEQSETDLQFRQLNYKIKEVIEGMYKFGEVVNKIEQNMNSHQQDLAALRRQVMQLENRSAAKPEVKQNVAEKQERLESKSEELKSAAQEQGAEQDVSIEKMFYFGKK